MNEIIETLTQKSSAFKEEARQEPIDFSEKLLERRNYWQEINKISLLPPERMIEYLEKEFKKIDTAVFWVDDGKHITYLKKILVISPKVLFEYMKESYQEKVLEGIFR